MKGEEGRGGRRDKGFGVERGTRAHFYPLQGRRVLAQAIAFQDCSHGTHSAARQQKVLQPVPAPALVCDVGEDEDSIDHDKIAAKRSRSDYVLRSSVSGPPPLPLTHKAFSTGELYVSEAAAARDVIEGLKVIIVEDSQAQRKLLARLIQQCHPSWRVYTFQDSVECTRHLRAHNFDVDVIFIDMNSHGGSAKTASSSSSSHAPLAEATDKLASCSLSQKRGASKKPLDFPPDVAQDVSVGASGPEFVRLLRSVFGMARQVIIGLNRDYRAVERPFLVAGADTAWSKPLPSSEVAVERIRSLLQSRMLLNGL